MQRRSNRSRGHRRYRCSSSYSIYTRSSSMGRRLYPSSIVASRWTALWETLVSAVRVVINTPKRCQSSIKRILLATRKAPKAVCKPSLFTNFKQSPPWKASWPPTTQPRISTFRVTKPTRSYLRKMPFNNLSSAITKSSQSPETAASMKIKSRAEMQAPYRPLMGQDTITLMARFSTSTQHRISTFTITVLS